MAAFLKGLYQRYVKDNSAEENLVLLSVASIFLPFYLSAAVLLFIVVRALCLKITRKMIFSGLDIKLVASFGVLNVITPFVFKNWLGVACFAGFALMLVFALYVRAVITERLFSKIGNVIVFMSLIPAFFSTFISDPRHDMRSPSFFFNPNYYGAAITFVILLCAYRLLTDKQNKALLIIAIIANLYGLWQADSQSALFSIVFGILLLLLFTKKYKTLLVVGVLVVLAVLALIFVPQLDFLLPRISGAAQNITKRATIWQAGIQGFLENFLFGRGLMGYVQIYEKFGGAKNFHCHNLIIDLLLSFGIIGVAPLAAFVVRPIKKAFKSKYAPLTFAVLGAVLLHGLTDVTLIWIQTGALAALFLSFPYIKEESK
ncbi:MAG: O-antigen ligase family protein [Oscillospiraceae bacterium]|nr:O-antigen ligase family protein [Oscillospiraceae bacterium]